MATVAINNATNAALLAIRILGTLIPSLVEKLKAYSQDQEKQVMEKVDALESQGWSNYK